MATGIAQKNYKALIPSWFIKKKDILKLIKQKLRRGKLKALERILILKKRKR